MSKSREKLSGRRNEEIACCTCSFDTWASEVEIRWNRRNQIEDCSMCPTLLPRAKKEVKILQMVLLLPFLRGELIFRSENAIIFLGSIRICFCRPFLLHLSLFSLKLLFTSLSILFMYYFLLRTAGVAFGLVFKCWCVGLLLDKSRKNMHSSSIEPHSPPPFLIGGWTSFS